MYAHANRQNNGHDEKHDSSSHAGRFLCARESTWSSSHTDTLAIRRKNHKNLGDTKKDVKRGFRIPKSHIFQG
jgi:hypothetical protein